MGKYIVAISVIALVIVLVWFLAMQMGSAHMPQDESKTQASAGVQPVIATPD